MTLILLQTGVVFAVAVCLGCWVVAQRRRAAQSWQQLIARLRLHDAETAVGALSFDPETPVSWHARRAAMRSVWALFSNAGIMLQMADFAARNGAEIDPEILADLRMDALQTRFYALGTLRRLATQAARDAATMNALRAQAAYAEMTLRLTELLEVRAAGAVPAFIAAV